MNVHKLSAFNVFLLCVAPAVQCSNLCYYILHWFSSDILLLQPVSAFFVITMKQFQCENIKNCINCLAPKLSRSQYEVCSFKCWKPPTDFPNNMQFNGWQLNSNNLHSTPGFQFWCQIKKLRSDFIWGMRATVWFRNPYLLILYIIILTEGFSCFLYRRETWFFQLREKHKYFRRRIGQCLDSGEAQLGGLQGCRAASLTHILRKLN